MGTLSDQVAALERRPALESVMQAILATEEATPHGDAYGRALVHMLRHRLLPAELQHTAAPVADVERCGEPLRTPGPEVVLRLDAQTAAVLYRILHEYEYPDGWHAADVDADIAASDAVCRQLDAHRVVMAPAHDDEVAELYDCIHCGDRSVSHGATAGPAEPGARCDSCQDCPGYECAASEWLHAPHW